MRSQLSVLATLVIIVGSTNAFAEMRSFDINLDASPELRFKEPSNAFAQEIKHTMELIYESVPSLARQAFWAASFMIQPFFHERYAEIEGIATTVGIDVNKALIANYIYELSSFCTSIAVRDSTGLLSHLRILDFGFSDQIRSLTYRANFIRNGEVVFEGVMFGGVVGVFTGVKKDSFSVSLNQR